MQTHFPRKYTYSIPSRYEHIKEEHYEFDSTGTFIRKQGQRSFFFHSRNAAVRVMNAKITTEQIN